MTRLPRLLFYCQHSLGMGHLMRSRALALALAGRFDVTFVTGGAMPHGLRLPGAIRTVPLPPVGMDQEGRLVSHDKRRTVERAMVVRRRILLDTYRTLTPDVVVIELFPFGRRKFLSELEPILEIARTTATKPLVACSLRDILVSRSAAHDERASALLERYFDVVLVHSDPAFARLEDSCASPVTDRVPVRYTGFVHGETPAGSRPTVRPGSIVVSAGGGVVGGPLFRCALDAHGLLPASDRPRLTLWAGPFLPDDEYRALGAAAKSRASIVLRRTAPNLALELSQAAASISQCGYNTVMDLLAARVPALVVPYGEGSEDEQLKRARKLEALGVVRVLPSRDLTPERMAEQMASLRDFRPAAAGLNLDGASRTARMLGEMIDADLTARTSGASLLEPQEAARVMA